MYNILKPSKNYTAKLLGLGLLILVCLILSLMPSLPISYSQPLPILNTIVLNDQQGEYHLGKFLEILVDPTKELTITDVAQPQQKFNPSQRMF